MRSIDPIWQRAVGKRMDQTLRAMGNFVDPLSCLVYKRCTSSYSICLSLSRERVGEKP